MVSRGRGTDPVWSADGTRIFYRNDRQFFIVRVVTAGSELALGPPVPFSEGEFLNDVGQWCDMSPRRRAISATPESPAPNRQSAQCGDELV